MCASELVGPKKPQHTVRLVFAVQKPYKKKWFLYYREIGGSGRLG